MTPSDEPEHAYARALRLIEALLTLSTQLHEENVMLRVTIEARLARIEAHGPGAVPVVPPPVPAVMVNLRGTRRNVSAMVLDALAAGPRRLCELSRDLNIISSNVHAVLTRLHKAGLIERSSGKTWALTPSKDQGKVLPWQHEKAVG